MKRRCKIRNSPRKVSQIKCEQVKKRKEGKVEREIKRKERRNNASGKRCKCRKGRRVREFNLAEIEL